MEGQKSSNDKEVTDLLIASTVPIALQYLANKIAGTVPAARMQKAAVKGWSVSRAMYPTTIGEEQSSVADWPLFEPETYKGKRTHVPLSIPRVIQPSHGN